MPAGIAIPQNLAGQGKPPKGPLGLTAGTQQGQSPLPIQSQRTPPSAPYSRFSNPRTGATPAGSHNTSAPSPLPSGAGRQSPCPAPMAGLCRHPPSAWPAFPERRGRNRPALLPALAASGANLRQPFAGNPRSRASGTGSLYRACPAVPSRQEHRLQEEWRPSLCIELAAACCAL